MKPAKDILCQILTCASVSNNQGIVHRDVKLSNVMHQENFDCNMLELLDMNKPWTSHVLGDYSSAWNHCAAENSCMGGMNPVKKHTSAHHLKSKCLGHHCHHPGNPFVAENQKPVIPGVLMCWH